MSEKSSTKLPTHPYFAEYNRVILLQPDRIAIRSPKRTVVIRGASNFKNFPPLLRLLNGKRTVPEIIAELETKKIPGLLTITMLGNLAQNGLLRDAPPVSHPPQLLNPGHEHYSGQLLFFEQISPYPAYFEQSLLLRSQVLVFGLGLLGSHLIATLARAGVGRIIGVDCGIIDSDNQLGTAYPHSSLGFAKTEAAANLVKTINPHLEFIGLEQAIHPDLLDKPLAALLQPDTPMDLPPRAEDAFGRSDKLVVAALDNPSPLFYEELNRQCLDYSLNWTQAQFENFSGLIGPTVIPNFGPCYHCYRLRSHSHSPNYELQLAIESSLDQPVAEHFRQGQLASFAPLLANCLATEVLKLLGNYAYSETIDRLITFDLLNLKLERHTVLKLPNCSACGRLSSRYPTPAHYDAEAEKVSYA